MNKKLTIKFIVFSVAIIVIILLAVKIYYSDNSNKTDKPIIPNTPTIKEESLVYKHFEYKIPNELSYMTDEYYVHLYYNEEWEAQIDMILDNDSLMKDNPGEVKNDLKARNFNVEEGPIDVNNWNINYFYYKVTKDSKPYIIAYSYAEKYYIFEIVYSNINGIEDMSNVEKLVDICKKSKKDVDSDKVYTFNKFYVSNK